MTFLTVFTPTYNRAHTLSRTYEWMCRQSNQQFVWLIVDDGSTDGTEQMVRQWIRDGKHQFELQYVWKENGGLHTGYNKAIELINTELCICCDSDDYLPEDAVEYIYDVWEKQGGNHVAGIIGLDYIAGENIPIGGFFKDTSKTYHFLEFESKLHHYGDTKMVHRTEVLKPFVPMKSFHGEKNFNPIYIFMKVDPELSYILVNKNLCYVDYQPTGMRANIYRQFCNSPRSFAELRKLKISHPRVTFRRKFIDAAHLFASALIAKDFSVYKDVSKKWLCILAAPLGLGIYMIIKFKTKNKFE